MVNPNDFKIRELLVEKACRVKGTDEALVNRKAATVAGREMLWFQELDQTLRGVFKKGWAAPKEYRGQKAVYSERAVNVVLGDLHFGANLDQDECPLQYSAIQESRRFGKVALQTADYKPNYRHKSKLIIHLIGDLIQGNIHDAREGTILVDQFTAAVQYITQFIMYEAGAYPRIEVYFTPGNHGRNPNRHPDQPIQQKYDSFETMIYIAVQKAVITSGLKNVKFSNTKRPYYTVDIFGNKVFATHGDTVFNIGNPGKSIDTKSFFHQICRWNSAKNIGGPFKLFLAGHMHIASITNLPGEIIMMTNGCLVPPDDYALSIGIPDATNGQYLFESTRDYVCGDQRFVRVSDADNDKEYNRIISPYEGLQ
jgi:Calcineurin-like phosphoesterase